MKQTIFLWRRFSAVNNFHHLALLLSSLFVLSSSLLSLCIGSMRLLRWNEIGFTLLCSSLLSLRKEWRNIKISPMEFLLVDELNGFGIWIISFFSSLREEIESLSCCNVEPVRCFFALQMKLEIWWKAANIPFSNNPPPLLHRFTKKTSLAPDNSAAAAAFPYEKKDEKFQHWSFNKTTNNHGAPSIHSLSSLSLLISNFMLIYF